MYNPTMSRRKRYTRNLGRSPPEPLPPRTTTTWLRFEHEIEPYGVFAYIRDAMETLDPPQREEMEEIRGWFNGRLDAPELLERLRFWFKAEATDYGSGGDHD